MANQTATLSVIAKLTDQLSGPLKNIEGRLNGLSNGFGSLKGVAIRAFGAVGVGLGLSAVVANMKEAEESTHQLTLAVKNLGAESGITVKQVQGLAAEIQRTTTFSDEAVQDASSALLRFGAVTSNTLKPTLAVVADLAAGMGTDLSQAAYMVGRALADPERGLRMLRQAGVVFTKDQTAAIKKLVETGQEAKASGIILGEISRIYGGAATAAVNTFSGALERLKNNLGNLLEGGEGSLRDATKALNDFTDVISAPETKQAADDFFGVVIKGAKAAVDLLVQMYRGITNIADGIASVVNGDAIKQAKLQLDFLKQIQGESNFLGGGRALLVGKWASNGVAEYLSKSELDQRIKDTESAIAQLQNAGGSNNGRVYKPGKGGAGKMGADDLTGTVKPDKGDLSEVVPTADYLTAKRQADMEESTRTSARKIVDAYDKQVAAIKQLELEHVIGHDEALKRLKDLNDNFNEDQLAEVRVTAEKIGTALRTPVMEFVDALKTGLQNAAVQGKFSLKSLTAFIIAELSKRELFKAIDRLGVALQSALGGSSGSGGFFKTIGTFIGGLFGHKAGGGRTDRPTWVGEEGPELFVPATGGTVYNARAMRAMAGGRSGQSVKYYDNRNYSISGVETQQVIGYIEQTRREDQRGIVRMLERNGLGSMR